MYVATFVTVFQGPEVVAVASTSAVEEEFAPSGEKTITFLHSLLTTKTVVSFVASECVTGLN